MKINVKSAIEESADNLIGLGLVEEIPQYLLENAIHKWLEDFVDDLSHDIEWFYHNDSKLKKRINNIDVNEQINEDDAIDLEELFG